MASAPARDTRWHSWRATRSTPRIGSWAARISKPPNLTRTSAVRRSSGCCSSPMPPSPTSTSCRLRCARSSTQRPRSTCVTPTLPGRLAWLADDVDRFRHIADERLDTVLATCTRSTPRQRSGRPWQRPDRDRGRRRGVRARPHPARAAQPRARQLAGAQADRAHRAALRPAGDDLRGRPRTATRRPPTARCCSATTDPRTPSTPSSARASCSRGRHALVVTVWQPTAALGSRCLVGRDRRHGQLRRGRTSGRRDRRPRRRRGRRASRSRRA